MENEIWKPVVGYEGLYDVSNMGNVRVLPGKYRTAQVLKPGNNDGYLIVKLTKDRIRKCYFVSRLVAMAFLTNTENKPEVNHIDGNRFNNVLSNLEWVTSMENKIHASRMGLLARGERAHTSKLTSKEVIEIRELYKTGKYSHRTLATIFNIGKTAIYNIINKRSWSHI